MLKAIQQRTLREFGLNSYETKLWTALLSRGVSTAGELSDIANVPRSRSYDVLESLEKKGFVIMKLGKPIKYIAVPPKEVINQVKKKLEEKTGKQANTINLLKTSEIFRQLGNLYRQGITQHSEKEMSGSLRDRKNIYRHLETMLRNARKSVVLVTNQKRLEEKLSYFKNIILDLAKKGVDINIKISQCSKDKLPTIHKNIKITETDVSTRFCVVDGKEILFMLFSDDEIHPGYDVAIWVVDEELSKHFQDLF